MYPESQPTSTRHSWRRTISYWGATARTLRMGPRPPDPIINPLALGFIMDQHSQVGLVGQRGSSPGLVALIDLVGLGHKACFGGKARE